MSRFPPGIALAVALCLRATVAQDDTPPIFDRRPYAEAKQAAAKAKKWFVAKATAAGCIPCREMDLTTWRDEKVVAWLRANAVVVAFDVDQEKQLAADLAVAAMPTMLACRDGGAEFDRIVGYKSPAQFLAWLEGLAKGETALEARQRRAGDRVGADGKVHVNARLDLAREWMLGGKVDAAVDECVWLWQNMLDHDPAMYGVRLSFLAGEMQILARQPAAKKRFVALRDETGKALGGAHVDIGTVMDWVKLNAIVGEPEATLAWFDRVKAAPDQRRLVEAVTLDLERLLIDAGRWADLGRLATDPLTDLERHHAVEAMDAGHEPEGVDAKALAELRAARDEDRRTHVACIHAGLLAAGRDDDAEALVARARAYDPAPALIAILVEKALLARQPRPAQLAWLDAMVKAPDAERLDAATMESLRARVAAALAKATKKK